jgi:hypothetical protein
LVAVLSPLARSDFGQRQEQKTVLSDNVGRVTKAMRREFSYHVKVSEKHRFVYFGLPKNGCTRWFQFMRRLNGDEMSNKLPPHSATWNPTPMLNDYPTKTIQQWLRSPLWTKIVFVRSPTDRLLSAYPGTWTNSPMVASAGKSSTNSPKVAFRLLMTQ